MANSKGGQIGRRIVLIVLIIFILLCYAAAIGIYSLTIVAFWMPLLPAAALGFAVAPWLTGLTGRLTALKSKIANYLIAAVALTGITLAALLVCNMALADASSIHRERAAVESLYSENRQRTRRVGRRYVANGETYKVYYAKIRLRDGRSKDIHVSFERYRALKRTDSIELELEAGAFGMPVMKKF